VHEVKIFTKHLGGRPNTEVIWMGEKKSDFDDYYMNEHDFPSRVEFYRHGLKLGSNYLFLDGHVGSQPKTNALTGMDPWDLPIATPSP
jgi:prepilin-type processing-associated H-X9-DG protein